MISRTSKYCGYASMEHSILRNFDFDNFHPVKKLAPEFRWLCQKENSRNPGKHILIRAL